MYGTGSLAIGGNPSSDAAVTGRGAHRALDARKADAAAGRLDFHRARHIDNSNSTTAGLRMDRAVYFAEVNLPAACFYSDEFRRFADGNVAAFRDEFGAASNALSSNVSAAGVQICFARDITRNDVPAGRESGDVAEDVANLNVSAFGNKFCDGPAVRSVLQAVAADAQRADVATLCDERSGAADIHCFDVADFRVDVEVVGGRNGNFEVHGELHSGGALLREGTNDFDAVWR